MKVVIDALDKIHGDVVSVLVEKMQHTLEKLFDRDEKSIIAHIFILRWGRVGVGNNAPQFPLSFAAFWVSLLVGVLIQDQVNVRRIWISVFQLIKKRLQGF
ncbi:hypothetical protein [Holospora undulata]|uniref:Uncharacterized protein n=1 Tax=Holospora undulata HU1 TaxID=1321371 RepID=A0A061JI79_9PROT|nr:hypothetical protein [Holospora undulata]ETZ05282.1 hypothetical protein K737_300281 [Holospora undulata HU1]